MSKNSSNLLPQVSFSILFALSLKPRHGYELMQQVEADSRGIIKIGPGALYGAIKQLREDELIQEIEQTNERRRYYQLTTRGAERLGADMQYFADMVQLAKLRGLVEDKSLCLG